MASDGDSGLSKTTQVSSLDFGDPLYLHASKTSTTALISLKLKGTENYSVWSRSMILALQTKNKVGFIDGTYIKHDSDSVLMKQWDRCNSVVLSWILNSISDDLFSGQVFSSSALLELKETYDKIDGSITFNLHKKLNSLSQNGSSISDYYHKLNALWKQFDALVKLPACTCHASKDFKSHSDLIKLMQFLMGLDDSYSAIRSNILLSEPLPSVKSAFATISREESHRGSSFSATTSKTPNTAFLVSKTFDNKKVIGRGPNPNLKCTKCGKLGLTVDRCYDIVGYPPEWVKRNNNTYNNISGNKVVSNYSLPDANINNSVSSMPFSNEQISKLMSLINDKSVGTSAHINMEGNFLNNNEFFNAHINKFFHPNSSKITENVNLGWIIDSGATQHMTVSTKNLFNVVNVTNLGLTVSHPNGTFAKVTAIGNLKLTNKIVLYDILVIPEYCDFIPVKS
ncbi:uncharacterized protein [Rutidosis leptorrhynchoides]|uniref:uncharacterized protein n=1 Tax=Rutidosis leptorrhynchoides TaxID=125765 RepID=UPI003A99F50D